jgi:hypothetical protein
MHRLLIFGFLTLLTTAACSDGSDKKEDKNNAPATKQQDATALNEADAANNRNLSAADPQVEAMLNEIKGMEKELMNAPEKNKAMLDRYIAQLVGFTNTFPDHALADEMLNRAASYAYGVAELTGKDGKADKGYCIKSIAINKRILEEYPATVYRRMVIEQIATIYDFDLEDDEEAKVYYDMLLKEFGAEPGVKELHYQRTKYPKVTQEDIIKGKVPADYRNTPA